MTMKKNILVATFIWLFSYNAKAEYDPCALDFYPVVQKQNFKHALTVEQPAVFLANTNSKIILSVADLIDLSTSKLNTNMPYYEETIKHFKARLLSLEKPLEDISFLQPDLSSLKGREQQVAINIYGFIIKGFQAGLFTSKAMVTVDDDVVPTSTFTLQVGDEPQPIDEFNKVHKIKFISNGEIVYESCWMDK
ncbi:hypothetical protein [Aliiglaciecola litoralis]|uniref:Uncharacterized protein n=1 Tax=Aliiglaciecola litoralis TaxID=582857 RepID=A0ABP3WQY5_9ALTE